MDTLLINTITLLIEKEK